MSSIAEKIAEALGAVKVSNNPVGTAQEYILDNKRIAVKILGGTNSTVTVTYKMLERVNLLVVALEMGFNSYDVYSISTDDFKANMSRGDTRIPPIGMLHRTKLKEKGRLLKKLSL